MSSDLYLIYDAVCGEEYLRAEDQHVVGPHEFCAPCLTILERRGHGIPVVCTSSISLSVATSTFRSDPHGRTAVRIPAARA
ncbi:hypothetical protein BC739_003159 [Kutzneria viridogrisea]|uniref:Uncharacterized protein n=1 Tax=Kutzneria viridogrisea TaxID=47990 RepID=A0ABR6BGG3_9PSEU|nr:hypothetical protein [Kutzneria viridogrisea]